MRKSLIFFGFFFCLLQCAWADKVYLQNGNVLEGRIIEEKNEFITLEFNLENGTGNTTILNSQIKSIEKAPLTDLKKEKIAAPLKEEEALASPRPKEDLEKERQRAILAVIFFPVVLLVLSFTCLFLLSKVFKAEFSRPFGIKLACFYLNTLNILFILLGLMFVSLAANRVIFDFKGINLFVFYFFMLGVPFIMFLLVTGLFYLRNWARILTIILLVVGLLSSLASLAIKRDFTERFFRDFYQRGMEQFIGELAQKEQGSVTQAAFNPNAAFISAFFFLLFILYLFRRETKKAFSEAAQLKYPVSIDRRGIILSSVFVLIAALLGNKIYQEYWKDFFHNPDLFSLPAKAGKVIAQDDSLLKGLAEYQALGFNLYLPPGMERLKTSAAGSTSAVFLERKKGIAFSITRLEEPYYRMFIASSRARWNPMLILLKSPRLAEKAYSVKMVRFEDKKGIMESGIRQDSRKYRFMLETGDSDYIECLLMTDEKDTFLEEKKVLNMIAAARKTEP